MKKSSVIFLQNRQITKKLKQSWIILTNLRNQCNQLQSQLNSNSYEAMQQVIRRLNIKKQKLTKQIVQLKKDLDCVSNPIDQEQQQKIKEIYSLHKQLEQKRNAKIQKQKSLEKLKNKLKSNTSNNQNSMARLQEVSNKFKQIKVTLNNQKIRENYQVLLEKKNKIMKIVQKRNIIKQQEYNIKIKELQRFNSKTIQFQDKEISIQKKINLLTQTIKQLKYQSKSKIRLKTQRATTQCSIQYPSAKMIHKRYSSLRPTKDDDQINEFLKPWQSSSSLKIQKQFQIRQLNKRQIGQKIRVYLNK